MRRNVTLLRAQNQTVKPLRTPAASISGTKLRFPFRPAIISYRVKTACSLASSGSSVLLKN